MSPKDVMTPGAIEEAARVLGVETPVVRAVSDVESNGSGFLPDGRPRILFEGHQFSKRTDHRFDASHPTISYPRWTKEHYQGGAREYERLERARALDRIAALESASWGAFQIMGFNARAAGFDTVDEFVEAMAQHVDQHLLAFVRFVKSQGLDDALQRKDWVTFSRGYNGSGYAVNRYHTKLADAYMRHGGDAA